MLGILFLTSNLACSQNKTVKEAYTSNPIIVKEDNLGNKTVVDWIRPDKVCENCKDVWTNKSGSKIWFEDIDGQNFDEILAIFAKNNDLNNFKVHAKKSLTKAHLLDEDGYGWTIMASANKNAEKYNLAAILVYGSLDESPKTTGIHAYLAKEKDFISSGGWVVPASFWLGVDPTTNVGDLVKQGMKEYSTQVNIFAQLSDLWIENIYQAYILQMQANVKALHNLRISAIAAWDSNAIVIPGDSGYNEIEYKNN